MLLVPGSVGRNGYTTVMPDVTPRIRERRISDPRSTENERLRNVWMKLRTSGGVVFIA
jgi:hypothetical protein